jgi:hypothetical protein
MKRWLIPGLLVAAFALAATGLADPGHGKGKGKPHAHGKFGPYDVVTDDHGSCGNPWAVDTEKRTFQVKKYKDGSYRLTRRDRGTFVTTAGQSPGACETKGRHGSTILPAKTGKFHGFLRGTITGGTFNPSAVCPADCGFTDVWITTFFGAGAQFSCNTDSRDCKFAFEYSAPRQGLLYHHWADTGRGAGTFLKERFRGDIASS